MEYYCPIEQVSEKATVAPRESMSLSNYLQMMVEHDASDLFFSVGAAVNIKIEGITKPINSDLLPPGAVQVLAFSAIDEDQQKIFEETMELNFGLSVSKVGRFRVNLYRQRGETAMVVRHIKTEIPSIEELHLPLVLKELVMEPRGLVLLVGATDSGKSTTLASMIDYRNTNSTGHILTIEEPIEFIHKHKKSIVDQREVGVDTLSYANALKNAMREAPDVILIGEIRDRKTMQQAIAYAETGHLCLSTLHANNSSQTLDRIINFFPDAARHQLLIDLSQNLRAVVSQRLVPGISGKRVPAVEVMLRSAFVSDLIKKGDIDSLRGAIEQAQGLGMQSFDQSLFELFQEGKISEQQALDNADSKNNLSVKLRLASGRPADESFSDLTLSD